MSDVKVVDCTGSKKRICSKCGKEIQAKAVKRRHYDKVEGVRKFKGTTYEHTSPCTSAS